VTAIYGTVTLTGVIEQEDNQFVAYCRELGTSSCGDTVQEAVHNLDEAIEVHLSGLIETGELERFLRERNIRIEVQPNSDGPLVRVPPDKIVTTYQKSVPVDAV
jgi:predicted RNase H-like HicB family nuclease